MSTIMTMTMTGPDFFKTVMVSLVSLLVGMVAIGAYLRWRERGVPVPPVIPVPAIHLFATAYVLLLVNAAAGRLERLGYESVTAAGWLTIITIAFNLVAVLVLLYFIHGYRAKSQLHAKVVRLERRVRDTPVTREQRRHAAPEAQSQG
jgi:uncharacterized membrane protein